MMCLNVVHVTVKLTNKLFSKNTKIKILNVLDIFLFFVFINLIIDFKRYMTFLFYILFKLVIILNKIYFNLKVVKTV